MKLQGYNPDRVLNQIVKKGDKVLIPKGVKILSRHPNDQGRDVISKMKQVVEVFFVNNGQTVSESDYFKSYQSLFPNISPIIKGGEKVYPIKNPTIMWVGSGRYYKEVDINLIEKVVEDEIYSIEKSPLSF